VASVDRGAAPGPVGPRQFLDQMIDRFDEASAGMGVDTRQYLIAGRRFELRFAGPALVTPLSAAFEHLRCRDGDEADMTVFLYDSASTGVRRPPAPWHPEQVDTRGLVGGFSDGPYRTVFEMWLRFLTVVDLDRRLAACWMANAERLSAPARAAPLWKLMQSYFVAHGLVVAHGGAVGRDRGGVLLAGQSGAGKSSTALACLTSSLRYAADDYCILDPTTEPHVHSLYCTGKRDAADHERRPVLAPMLANAGSLDREKAIYFLHPTLGDRLTSGFPLRAIVAPRVEPGAETVLRPTSRGTALVALAATTVLQAPHGAQETLEAVASLVESLPAYELVLGSGADRAPALLTSLLDDLERTS
jgi:hypothetical protein